MRSNRKIFICITGFLIFLSVAAAQTKTIDSLLRLQKNARQDTEKIMLNYKIAEQLSTNDARAASKYLDAGYMLAKTVGDKYYTARYYFKKGDLLFDIAKYTESLSYYDSAIAIYNTLITVAKTASSPFEKYIFEKTDCLIGKALSSAKMYHYQESTGYCLDGIAGVEDIKGNRKNVYLATLHADIASNYYEL